MCKSSKNPLVIAWVWRCQFGPPKGKPSHWGCFDTYLNQQNLPITYIAKKQREAPNISTGWFQSSIVIVFLIFLCILSETLNDLETNILSATQTVRTSFNHLFPPVFFCWSHEFKTPFNIPGTNDNRHKKRLKFWFLPKPQIISGHLKMLGYM